MLYTLLFMLHCQSSPDTKKFEVVMIQLNQDFFSAFILANYRNNQFSARYIVHPESGLTISFLQSRYALPNRTVISVGRSASGCMAPNVLFLGPFVEVFSQTYWK